MKLSEAAQQVIGMARAIRAYWDVELPKRHPDYPLMNAGERSVPPPPEKEKLQRFFAQLPQEMIYQLILIMYLGRGDFGTDNLADHLEQLKKTFTEPESAIRQMMGKAPLADYLTDGLDLLKKNKISVDKPFARPTKARR